MPLNTMRCYLTVGDLAMLPGGITLDPGERLIKRTGLRLVDPPVVPATPFGESHLILTNRRIILLAEKQHQYKVSSIQLNEMNRVEKVRFPGAGFVKIFTGTIIVIEYWDQGKIKILRIGIDDGESTLQMIEDALQEAGPAQQAPATPEDEQNVPLYCDECGTSLQPGARFCSNCGKTIEYP